MTIMKIYDFHGRYNCSGVYVREQRTALGLSQEELAAKLQLAGLEITQRAVSRIETGLRVVPDYEIPFFASALGVSPMRLLGLEEE